VEIQGNAQYDSCEENMARGRGGGISNMIQTCKNKDACNHCVCLQHYTISC
jgi:hypothetical protein